MTTREDFEAEARKHGFILDRLDKSGEYVQLITEQAWSIWQAATAAALAAPAHPERKPMGQFEIEAAYQESQQHHLRPQDFNKVCDMVRAVEAFHGITGGKT